MTEHKFTDEEVIRVLEWCIACNARQFANCDGCPLENCYPDCDDKIEKMSLDLIKRQRAEIERVTIDMNAARLGMIAEHERLKTARAEAVKKFSDRLKTYYRTLNGSTSAGLVEYHIDQILNEMIGEQP